MKNIEQAPDGMTSVGATFHPDDYIQFYLKAVLLELPDPIRATAGVMMDLPYPGPVLSQQARTKLEELVTFYKKNAVPGRVLAATLLLHRHCTPGNCFHNNYDTPKGIMQ